jgi:hypothetical protein
MSGFSEPLWCLELGIFLELGIWDLGFLPSLMLL